MALMKPVRKRSKGGGNSNPQIRNAFSETNQLALDDSIDSHIRLIGQQGAMNFFENKHLQSQQAEIPRTNFKLHPLTKALLQAQPPAQNQLQKSEATHGCRDESVWARGSFKALGDPAPLLPGKAADCMVVLLKHWRRITAAYCLGKVWCKA